jgi:hypothetical protein
MVNILVESRKNAVHFSWDSSAEPAFTGCRIYVSTLEKGSYTLLANVSSGDEYEHTGLAKGQSLWYKFTPLGPEGTEDKGALDRAVPFRGKAFGGSPGPIQVESDYHYNSHRFIRLSWPGGTAPYYRVEIFREDGRSYGNLMLYGSSLFRNQDIIWDPVSLEKFQFVLEGVYSEDLLEDDISYPSEISPFGFISQLNE